MTRPSGGRFHTIRYHVFRITNNNALKMDGATTEWVMARTRQTSKKANEAYERADEHKVRKAAFGLLGILYEGKQSGDDRETKVKDGSMTFTEMMELIRRATRRLMGLRLGHTPDPPTRQMTLDGFIYEPALRSACGGPLGPVVGGVKPHGGQNSTGPQCRLLIEQVGHKNLRL